MDAGASIGAPAAGADLAPSHACASRIDGVRRIFLRVYDRRDARCVRGTRRGISSGLACDKLLLPGLTDVGGCRVSGTDVVVSRDYV